MTSKRKRSYQYEAWYRPLRAAVEKAYFGQSSALTIDQLKSVARTEQIEAPDDADWDAMKDNFQRLMRERLAALKPRALTDQEAETLTIESYEPAMLEVWGKAKSGQVMSAANAFLHFLKSVIEGNSLNRVDQARHLRIRFLTEENVAAFAEHRRRTDDCDASYPSKVRMLLNFVHGQTTNAAGSRASVNYTGSPEIEKALLAYQHSAQTKDERTTFKTNASVARKMIRGAGIKTLADLLTTDGQIKIALFERDGGIGSLLTSKGRPAIRWILEEYGVEVLGYFKSKRADTIADLSQSPEIDKIAAYARTALEQSQDRYAESTTKNLLVFIRHIVRASGAKTKEQFYAITPAQFVVAILEAEERGNTLEPFKKIKAFITAFTQILPLELQWPEMGSQTYEEFVNEVASAKGSRDSALIRSLKVSDFKDAFSSHGVRWSAFFKSLKDFYYFGSDNAGKEVPRPLTMEELRDASGKETRSKVRMDFHEDEDELDWDAEEDEPELFRYTAEDYDLIRDYVLKLGWGDPCGNRLRGAAVDPRGDYRSGGLVTKVNLSTDERQELESLTALALAWAARLRFRSEAERLVLWEGVPEMASSSRKQHLLFFWPEKNCFAIHLSTKRKNKISGLASLNVIADLVVAKYLKVDGKKNRESIFNRSITFLADEIRRHLSIIFASKLDDQMFLDGARARAIPPHQLRHIGRRHDEARYHGTNAELARTTSLLHKITRGTKDRSSVADVYGDPFLYSFSMFDLNRAIKSGDYRDPFIKDADNRELRQVERDSKNQRETIAEIKKVHPKTAKDLMRSLRDLPEEERVKFLKDIEKEVG